MTSAGVNAFPCLGELSTFTFQMDAKPGFSSALLEIFASFRTQFERCASPPTVFQSPAPRPNWACATPAPVMRARIAVSLRIGELLRLFPAKRLRDRLFGERGHYFVTGVVRDESVAGQFLFEVAAVGERGVIVEIDRA